MEYNTRVARDGSVNRLFIPAQVSTKPPELSRHNVNVPQITRDDGFAVPTAMSRGRSSEITSVSCPSVKVASAPYPARENVAESRTHQVTGRTCGDPGTMRSTHPIRIPRMNVNAEVLVPHPSQEYVAASVNPNLLDDYLEEHVLPHTFTPVTPYSSTSTIIASRIKPTPTSKGCARIVVYDATGSFRPLHHEVKADAKDRTPLDLSLPLLDRMHNGNIAPDRLCFFVPPTHRGDARGALSREDTLDKHSRAPSAPSTATPTLAGLSLGSRPHVHMPSRSVSLTLGAARIHAQTSTSSARAPLTPLPHSTFPATLDAAPTALSAVLTQWQPYFATPVGEDLRLPRGHVPIADTRAQDVLSTCAAVTREDDLCEDSTSASQRGPAAVAHGKATTSAVAWDAGKLGADRHAHRSASGRQQNADGANTCQDSAEARDDSEVIIPGTRPPKPVLTRADFPVYTGALVDVTALREYYAARPCVAPGPSPFAPGATVELRYGLAAHADEKDGEGRGRGRKRREKGATAREEGKAHGAESSDRESEDDDHSPKSDRFAAPAADDDDSSEGSFSIGEDGVTPAGDGVGDGAGGVDIAVGGTTATEEAGDRARESLESQPMQEGALGPDAGAGVTGCDPAVRPTLGTAARTLSVASRRKPVRPEAPALCLQPLPALAVAGKGDVRRDAEQGYCECCRTHFYGPVAEHVKCASHVRYLANERNFERLAALSQQLDREAYTKYWRHCGAGDDTSATAQKGAEAPQADRSEGELGNAGGREDQAEAVCDLFLGVTGEADEAQARRAAEERCVEEEERVRAYEARMQARAAAGKTEWAYEGAPEDAWDRYIQRVLARNPPQRVLAGEGEDAARLCGVRTRQLRHEEYLRHRQLVHAWRERQRAKLAETATEDLAESEGGPGTAGVREATTQEQAVEPSASTGAADSEAISPSGCTSVVAVLAAGTVAVEDIPTSAAASLATCAGSASPPSSPSTSPTAIMTMAVIAASAESVEESGGERDAGVHMDAGEGVGIDTVARVDVSGDVNATVVSSSAAPTPVPVPLPPPVSAQTPPTATPPPAGLIPLTCSLSMPTAASVACLPTAPSPALTALPAAPLPPPARAEENNTAFAVDAAAMHVGASVTPLVLTHSYRHAISPSPSPLSSPTFLITPASTPCAPVCPLPHAGAQLVEVVMLTEVTEVADVTEVAKSEEAKKVDKAGECESDSDTFVSVRATPTTSPRADPAATHRVSTRLRGSAGGERVTSHAPSASTTHATTVTATAAATATATTPRASRAASRAAAASTSASAAGSGSGPASPPSTAQVSAATLPQCADQSVACPASAEGARDERRSSTGTDAAAVTVPTEPAAQSPAATSVAVPSPLDRDEGELSDAEVFLRVRPPARALRQHNRQRPLLKAAAARLPAAFNALAQPSLSCAALATIRTHTNTCAATAAPLASHATLFAPTGASPSRAPASPLIRLRSRRRTPHGPATTTNYTHDSWQGTDSVSTLLHEPVLLSDDVVVDDSATVASDAEAVNEPSNAAEFLCEDAQIDTVAGVDTCITPAIPAPAPTTLLLATHSRLLQEALAAEQHVAQLLQHSLSADTQSHLDHPHSNADANVDAIPVPACGEATFDDMLAAPSICVDADTLVLLDAETSPLASPAAEDLATVPSTRKRSRQASRTRISPSRISQRRASSRARVRTNDEDEDGDDESKEDQPRVRTRGSGRSSRSVHRNVVLSTTRETEAWAADAVPMVSSGAATSDTPSVTVTISTTAGALSEAKTDSIGGCLPATDLSVLPAEASATVAPTDSIAVELSALVLASTPMGPTNPVGAVMAPPASTSAGATTPAALPLVSATNPTAAPACAVVVPPVEQRVDAAANGSAATVTHVRASASSAATVAVETLSRASDVTAASKDDIDENESFSSILRLLNHGADALINHARAQTAETPAMPAVAQNSSSGDAPARARRASVSTPLASARAPSSAIHSGASTAVSTPIARGAGLSHTPAHAMSLPKRKHESPASTEDNPWLREVHYFTSNRRTLPLTPTSTTTKSHRVRTEEELLNFNKGYHASTFSRATWRRGETCESPHGKRSQHKTVPCLSASTGTLSADTGKQPKGLLDTSESTAAPVTFTPVNDMTSSTQAVLGPKRADADVCDAHADNAEQNAFVIPLLADQEAQAPVCLVSAPPSSPAPGSPATPDQSDPTTGQLTPSAIVPPAEEQKAHLEAPVAPLELALPSSECILSALSAEAEAGTTDTSTTTEKVPFSVGMAFSSLHLDCYASEDDQSSVANTPIPFKHRLRSRPTTAQKASVQKKRSGSTSVTPAQGISTISSTATGTSTATTTSSAHRSLYGQFADSKK